MNKVRRTPIPVQRALHKLGADIHDARLRRRIPAQLLAERAQISRTTLHKIEQGTAGVSVGHLASVLFSLGFLDALGDLADARHDPVGLKLEAERLPQRIRVARSGAKRSRRP
ncbi:MAG: helix-turn-helix domain-containing protein [Salinisphaera sp.]|nr:helix-turn-helix domain-containing protein [Salinisphaera sp.]